VTDRGGRHGARRAGRPAEVRNDSEFVGRLPVVSVLNELSEDELISILTETRNAMIKQYSKLFAMEGVNLNFTKDALQALAEAALKKGTGARALRACSNGSCLT